MEITNPYESFIYKSRYARWLPDENRREQWGETVDRYVNFMVADVRLRHDYTIPADLVEEVRQAILSREVLPSMRALMTAGPALARENVAGYNCAFLAADDPRAFDEALYILMNGTGVGFSVESRFVSQLPTIPDTFSDGPTIRVKDSKQGWAEALQQLIAGLYKGVVHDWDTSDVRPAGAPLRTFGGRASGPEPLNELLNFVVAKFVDARGGQLTTLQAHEIFCKIGEVVVVGGVRRSALISLSDLWDTSIRDAKKGSFWETMPHLTLSNNSAVYDERPSRKEFDAEFDALIASGSGERGIFSRYGAKRKVESIGRDADKIVGTNPCGEILLRSNQFCNLSTVVVRAEDTEEDLARKVRLAAVLGTLQSTMTDFNHLRPIWRENTEEERLLGVSLNGIFGHQTLAGKDGRFALAGLLKRLRTEAVVANSDLAMRIGIPRAAAITCVKPEGTTSQLTGVSSGMGPWHDYYYSRNVRGDMKDPLTQLLINSGVQWEIDVTNPSNVVFSFPVKAPENAITRNDLSAIEHLELWAAYAEHWTDHNPSVTINVRDHEWPAVRKWVWDNFDKITGVSFLPYSDHVYQQAPYQTIDADEYEELVEKTPVINWDYLSLFESVDSTKGSQELACVAGGCEIDYA